MIIEEKIGQMIIAGFEGKKITDKIKKIVLDMHIGGLILFSRNFETPQQVGALCNDLQNLAKSSSAKIPLFISIDHEGGRVIRLGEPFTQFEAASVIGSIGSTDLANSFARSIARELSAVGINMNFAPVLDIHTNPLNPVIGDRAFSSDPGIVCKMGLEVIKGLRSCNVIPVGKHFPGHGDTFSDSHFDLPVVMSNYNRLKEIELKPFVSAIQDHIDAIMTAHVVYPEIDSKYCATLSEKILQGILREDLGFNGLIISDDMEMKAVSGKSDIGEVSVKAAISGVDIILVCKDYNNIEMVYKGLLDAVNNRTLSIERVNGSVDRIIALKEKYHIKFRDIDMEYMKTVIGNKEHKKIAEEIRRKNIC